MHQFHIALFYRTLPYLEQNKLCVPNCSHTYFGADCFTHFFFSSISCDHFDPHVVLIRMDYSEITNTLKKTSIFLLKNFGNSQLEFLSLKLVIKKKIKTSIEIRNPIFSITKDQNLQEFLYLYLSLRPTKNVRLILGNSQLKL